MFFRCFKAAILIHLMYVRYLNSLINCYSPNWECHHWLHRCMVQRLSLPTDKRQVWNKDGKQTCALLPFLTDNLNTCLTDTATSIAGDTDVSLTLLPPAFRVPKPPGSLHFLLSNNIGEGGHFCAENIYPTFVAMCHSFLLTLNFNYFCTVSNKLAVGTQWKHVTAWLWSLSKPCQSNHHPRLYNNLLLYQLLHPREMQGSPCVTCELCTACGMTCDNRSIYDGVCMTCRG